MQTWRDCVAQLNLLVPHDVVCMRLPTGSRKSQKGVPSTWRVYELDNAYAEIQRVGDLEILGPLTRWEAGADAW